MDPATGLWRLAGQNGTDEGNGTIQQPEFLPWDVPQWALDAVASLVVIVLAWLVARLLVQLFSRRLARHFDRPSLTRVSLAGIRVGMARYPASPDCLVANFGDHGILLRLRYWVHEPYRIQRVQSKVQTNVWDAFEGENVEIAYPHSHLMFDETSGELQVATGADGRGPGAGRIEAVGDAERIGDDGADADGDPERGRGGHSEER